MNTTRYGIVGAIVIYCMILVVFKQNHDIERTRYERLSNQPVSGWDMGGLTAGVNAVMRESKPDLSVACPAQQAQALACDPILCQTIRDFNDDISREGSEELARQIEGTANMYGVDPYLVAALVSQESAFHQSAVSPVGALGLGQLMPETARDLGVDPLSPAGNLDGCVRYLAQNLDMWSNTSDPVAMALASYNAGPGAVEQFGGVPPYEETQNYVAIIKYRYGTLCNARSAS